MTAAADLRPSRPEPPARTSVATVAAIKHARNRPAVSRRNRRKAAKRGAQLVEVVSTRSFLVDVHLLNRE